jgi:predicted alpha-1,6-mannanase (GH76 family)
MAEGVKESIWGERAEQAQRALDSRFWNPEICMYNIATPSPDWRSNTIFHYWWMAHAVELLVDGWKRTENSFYKEKLSMLHSGILRRNGGSWPNNMYDDMEWMAIGWLRACLALREESYGRTALALWEDIKTGWNDHMDGGIAWQKTQLDYKNTPANAPAVILAARLYEVFNRQEDLEWAMKIYDWQKTTLIDPASGFVWDGVNRLGDGKIDKDWKFTYCQGVFIGAAVELYRLTGERRYLDDSVRTWHAAVDQLADPRSGLLPAEGNGDGGLFKGIFVRYAGELANVRECGRRNEISSLIATNARSLWNTAADGRDVLFGARWDLPPASPVELSTQITGIILLETTALLEME